jgi:hypothetical protein
MGASRPVLLKRHPTVVRALTSRSRATPIRQAHTEPTKRRTLAPKKSITIEGVSDRGQSHAADKTTVSAGLVHREKAIMPTTAPAPPMDGNGTAPLQLRQYLAPMIELPAAVDDQIEEIFQDSSLSREEKVRRMAAVFGITEPITAPQLFAHVCDFKPVGSRSTS